VRTDRRAVSPSTHIVVADFPRAVLASATAYWM